MSDIYEVEDILDRKYDEKTKQYLYLIKWKGYPSEQNTWEPRKNLVGMQSYVNEFDLTYEPLYKETMKQLLKKELLKFLELNKPKCQEVIQNQQEEIQIDVPIDLQTHNSHKLRIGFEWAEEEQAREKYIDY